MIKPEFRAAQLDLARQMENLETIKAFIDQYAQAGCNVLFLYLEWRVKTTLLAAVPDDECYTPEEMGEVIDYAAERGMRVIPGLALLGHAEQLLQYDAFRHLAEVAVDGKGRFGEVGAPRVLCSRRSEVREFCARYLTEICEIFNAEYIHVGLDEAWEFAFCEDCRLAVASGITTDQILLEHINFLHDILAANGRKMMMWDDMFEYHPAIVPQLPSDITVVIWQYTPDSRFYRGHMSDMLVDNPFPRYERLGLSYWVAPSDYSTGNIQSFSRFAADYNPSGALVTMWEKRVCLCWKSLPAQLFALHLWSGAAEPMKSVCRQLFGLSDSVLVKALYAYSTLWLNNEDHLSCNYTLTRSFFGFEQREDSTRELIRLTLASYESRIADNTGRKVMRGVLDSLEFDHVTWNFHNLTSAAADRWHFTAMLQAAWGRALEDYQALMDRIEEDHRLSREGVKNHRIHELRERTVREFTTFPEQFNQSGKLKLRLCLPDITAAPHLKVEFLQDGVWQEAASGVFKLTTWETVAYYESTVLVAGFRPEMLRLTASGFGSIGICFVEYLNPDGTHYRIGKFETSEGHVHDPEFASDNDCKFAMLGNGDVREAILQPKRTEVKHWAMWHLDNLGKISIKFN